MFALVRHAAIMNDLPNGIRVCEAAPDHNHGGETACDYDQCRLLRQLSKPLFTSSATWRS
jgi:hypothetical protein